MEWQHFGRTEHTNLVVLDRPSHLAKSAGLYEHALADSGVVEVTDPCRHVFEDPPDAPMDPAPADHLPPPDDDDPCPF